MLQAAGVSPTFLALLDQEPLAGLCALDVGTGAGRLALGSLAVPGYGLAFDPDLASMTPLEAWKPDHSPA